MRKIVEKCLRFYALVNKTTEKLENHKSANVKRKLNNMDQLMDIEKVNEFNLLKEEVEELAQQSSKRWSVKTED